MIVEFDCEVCGQHVRKKRSPANMRGNAGRFCSQKCNGIARTGTGKGQTVTHRYECAACGVKCSVYRPPSAPTPRFCSLKCTGLMQRGSANPSFAGGRVIQSHGYVSRLAPGHPDADCRGYVYEHRLVMEQVIGRRLRPEEVVHHINRIRHDNRPDNLQLMASQSEHIKLHNQEDRNDA